MTNETNEIEKRPGNFSQYDDYVIKCIGNLVPGQVSKLKDFNRNSFKGTCKQVSDILVVTTITKNGESWVSIVYNTETNEEKTFYGEKN